MIIGIDEVGRGSWAGPVVVGAVGLGGVALEGLTDSKLLTKTRREKFAFLIRQSAPLIGIGWVSAHDIDMVGISASLKLAARRALAQIEIAPDDQIIIDGTVRLLDDSRVTLMKKADLLVPSVSAASIIAKVARDSYMAACDEIFPGYGWASNVGYGAAAHHTAIRERGVTPLHRLCFEPMKSLTGLDDAKISSTRKNSQLLKNASDDKPATVRKETTRVGREAEQRAAQYLQARGYEILEQNWRTKWCEVDIIAVKDQVVHFVEVKYRKRSDQGGGIAAITPRKLGQMRFAAKLWLHNNGECDARVSAIEVSTDSFKISAFIESIE